MLRYLPPHLLAGRAHVIVDGAPRPGTACTLSHWPGTPTPPELRADLSADIVRRARRHPGLLPEQVDVVSIDHYDVDGVVALALLVVDGLDTEYGPLLVEVARVGDFDVVTDRQAALVAFALNGLIGGAPTSGADALERSGLAAQDALDLIPDLVADPERFEPMWREEVSAFDASVRALADGWATIADYPELDLAVVRVESAHDLAAEASWGSAPLHPAAVHSATPCLRVATVAGGRMEVRYRYESWVRLTSRRPRPRVDLERLSHVLNAAETAKARWVFDGAGAIRGALHLAGEGATTSIAPGCFLDLVTAELAALDQGPAAWDPYRVTAG